MSDILDLDLTQQDTSFPLVKPGIYQLRVDKADLMTNEAQSLALELRTTEPATSDKGDSLEPGQLIFDNVNTEPTGKAATSEKGKRAWIGSVKNFIMQLDNPSAWTIRRLRSEFKSLEGMLIKARVGIQPAGPDRNGTYRKARNTIEEYVK